MLGNPEHIDERNGEAHGQNEDEQAQPGEIAVGARAGEVMRPQAASRLNRSRLRDIVVIDEQRLLGVLKVCSRVGKKKCHTRFHTVSVAYSDHCTMSTRRPRPLHRADPCTDWI